MIGGTGFYLRTFMNGKPGGGKASPEIEQRVSDLLRTALVSCAFELGLQQPVAATSEDGTGSFSHTACNKLLHKVSNPSDAAAQCTRTDFTFFLALRVPCGCACRVHTSCEQGRRRSRSALHGFTSKHVSAVCAEFVKAALATVDELGGEVIVEEAELALWGAGCEVLRAVGDSAGADRYVARTMKPTLSHKVESLYASAGMLLYGTLPGGACRCIYVFWANSLGRQES